MTQAFRGVLFEITSLFRGSFPDVPLAEGVDLAELTEGDAKPFFITLPIAEKNAQSLNGRTYPPEEVQRVANAVNQERIGGILGHLRDDQRPYVYEIPVIHWVGALFEGNTLWTKGYVPQTQPALREFMRIAVKTKARTGTSVYGTAEVGDDGTVHNLKVESIDIAHADRVGIPMTAAVPAVTSETVKPSSEEKDNTMSDQNQNGATSTNPTTTAEQKPVETPMIAELKQAHREEIRALQETIVSLKSKAADFDKIGKVVEDKDGDVYMTVKARLAEMEALRRENNALLQDSIKSMAESVKVPSAIPAILEHLQALKPATKAEVKEAFDRLMEKEWVKAMLKAGVRQEMGGDQTRPTSETNQEQQSNDAMRITIPA